MEGVRIMKSKALLVAILGVVSIAQLLAAGSAAEGIGSNRGTYLSRAGYIVDPNEIKIEHYIAQRDYDYPPPKYGDLNVITGVGANAENAYMLIGLKGKKVDFQELPPLNVSFCIDRSGSMTHMIPWVKSCFYIFIDKVRPGDVISLVDMNTNAQTLIPPTQIQNEEDRTKFKRQVDRITASGGTDVYAGMRQSYREIEKNFQPGYVNRVVILTDGMHNFGEMVNQDILALAGNYKEQGINISTVLLGIQAAVGLMVDVAIEGGGSSRFVSDHDEMVKIFETELDRMLVPAAREVNMRLVLAEGVELRNTWGYRNDVEGNTIRYSLPTLHNGDYETILAEVLVKKSHNNSILGSLYLDYSDLEDMQRSLGPYNFTIDPSAESSNQLIADPRVREAEGYLALSRGLIDIGTKARKVGQLERDMMQYADPSPQRSDVVEQIKVELTQNIGIVERLDKYLTTMSDSLGGGRYEKELEILQNYNRTLTQVYDNFANPDKSGQDAE